MFRQVFLLICLHFMNKFRPFIIIIFFNIIYVEITQVYIMRKLDDFLFSIKYISNYNITDV
jgi:hypothetical protein